MHKTRMIILRTIRYGETSLIVTAFTEGFGVQTYMINGARSSKKTGAKAILYQPASLVEAEVYHNEKNTMHRIREANRAVVFKCVLTDVVKNSVAIFMMELLYKMLKQPEPNADLFYFCEDCLLQLDSMPPDATANFPLFFAMHLTHFFGFKIDDNFSPTHPFLDFTEGSFSAQQPVHQYFLADEYAEVTAELLRMQQPSELSSIKLNQQKRRELMAHYMDYYSFHNKDFGAMKTLAVMQEVLG